VLTLGLILDKDGQKMSKSKRNYVDPDIILDKEGADALRWYLVSASAPWMSKRFYEQAVKDTLGKFILTFWNSYNFFTTYASLDKFDPLKDSISYEKRSLLDKWILSRFNKTISEVNSFIEKFEIHKAAREIENFIIEDFSNWYLRRSRKRLWIEEKTSDKLAGYSTMYDICLGLSKLLAPFIPFITEDIYQNLRTDDMPESVHLCNYTKADDKKINKNLEDGMEKIRALVESGRALRSKIGIKVRYPLSRAVIVCDKKIETSIKDLLDLLNEEINVKEIMFERNISKFITKSIKPNYSNLGKRLKEKSKSVVIEIEKMDLKKLYDDLIKNKKITLNIENEKINLTKDDFQIIETEKENFARTETEDSILFIDTTLTPELKTEGLAREIVRRIQSMRKELDLDVEDRISTEINVSVDIKSSLKDWNDYIKTETRSKDISFTDEPSGKLVKKWKIDELDAEIGISK
jgi:isoleucyl-tRNA synthetase